jgi:hypothetical protein
MVVKEDNNLMFKKCLFILKDYYKQLVINHFGVNVYNIQDDSRHPLVADYNRLLQVQIKYFQNAYTGNQRHLCFFKWKGPILIPNLNLTFNQPV